MTHCWALKRKAWLAALMSLPVAAAVVPRMYLEEMVSEAPLIVHGRVGASWTAWDAKHMFLWTHYRIEVVESLKGSVPNLVVSRPGGELNGDRMVVPGTVVYTPGEEVVLFLERTPIGYWRALGYQQGKFNVVDRGGRKVVRPNAGGMALVEAAGKPGEVRKTGVERVDGWGLDEFEDLIRSLERGAQ